MALVSRRFTGGILALALLAVMGAGAAQFDGLFDTLELDGDPDVERGGARRAQHGHREQPDVLPRRRIIGRASGLQDAAHAILTSDTSTMSSTYVTLLSGHGGRGEAGDAVRVDVTGQLGWMGAALYVLVTNNLDQICADPRPWSTRSANAVCRDQASVIQTPSRNDDAGGWRSLGSGCERRRYVRSARPDVSGILQT